jgi:hypothetical protein
LMSNSARSFVTSSHTIRIKLPIHTYILCTHLNI